MVKDKDPQIAPIPQILEFQIGVIGGSPLPSSCRRRWRRVKAEINKAMRSDAGVPRPRLCVGVSSNVKQIRTPTQSRGRGTQNRPVERDAIEAEASVCTTLRRERHRTRERVTEGRGPAFEDAHRIRRCAPKPKSADLGKSRRFLRRCAAFFEGAQLLVRIFASMEAAGLGLPQAPIASGSRLFRGIPTRVAFILHPLGWTG